MTFYFAGIGCRRSCTAEALYELLSQSLREYDIAPTRLAAIASIDGKTDEAGLRELAERLDVSLLFFSAEQLRAYADRVGPASTAALQTAGTNVAETCALAAAEMLSGQRADLIIPKCKSADATFALAATTDSDT